MNTRAVAVLCLAMARTRLSRTLILAEDRAARPKQRLHDLPDLRRLLEFTGDDFPEIQQLQFTSRSPSASERRDLVMLATALSKVD